MPIARARVDFRRPGYERAKRALDVVLCVCALPIVLPVLGAASLAIWISDGRPIFFSQRRTGRAGRRFPMFKLRTMVIDAPQRKAELPHLNQRSGPDFKIDDDPRITRVGRWLRRSSLDELPQIFSVIRGDMSLVGPRPTSFAADTYTLWHTERLEVTPGITGLWQIRGRGIAEFDERVRMDIEYIERRSLTLDIEILFRTIKPVLTGRGAT